MNYMTCTAQELEQEYQRLRKQYEDEKGKGLSLNMARGKPGKAQLDLSLDMLDVLNSGSAFTGADQMDCRNYGILEGIEECRRLFGDILGVDYRNVMVGGSSSLNMMFDTISCMMTKPIVEGCKPCRSSRAASLGSRWKTASSSVPYRAMTATSASPATTALR